MRGTACNAPPPEFRNSFLFVLQDFKQKGFPVRRCQEFIAHSQKYISSPFEHGDYCCAEQSRTSGATRQDERRKGDLLEDFCEELPGVGKKRLPTTPSRENAENLPVASARIAIPRRNGKAANLWRHQALTPEGRSLVELLARGKRPLQYTPAVWV